MAKKLVKYSLVDTFTDSAFKGNPSAACLLEEEKDFEWLQNVAREFNQAVTSFSTRIDLVDDSFDLGNSANASTNGLTTCPRFRLRWFTRDGDEISICGHATLAASHFLMTNVLPDSDTIEFSTLSGPLTARRVMDPTLTNSFSVELNFPVLPLREYDESEVAIVSKILNSASIVELKITTVEEYLFVVLPSGEDVKELEPNFDAIQKYPVRGIIVTGPAPKGSSFDVYSRFFCPNLGVNEDHVCGSANCALAVYWCQRLAKNNFLNYQASRRSGAINVYLDEKKQRVLIRGKSVATMEGSVLI